MTPESILLYIELYILISVLLLLKTGIRIDNSCFLFWLIYTVFLGIGPIVCAVYRYVPSRWIDPFLFTLLPLAFFTVGVYISSGINRGSATRVSGRAKRNQKDQSNRKTVLLIFYFIGVIAGALYIVRTGLSVFSNDFNSERITSQSGMGPFLYLNGMLVVVIPMLFELVEKKKMSRLAFVVLLIVALGIFMLRGSRGLCAILIVMIVIQYSLKKRISSFGVLALVMLGVLGLTTLSLMRGSLGSDKTMSSYLINFFGVSFENMSIVIQAIPEKLEFQYGRTFLMNLAILMPGPDIDYTLWLKETLGLHYSGGGLTPSIIGDLFLNFGYYGAYFGLFILGLLLDKINSVLHNSDEHQVFFVYLALTLALCVTGGISASTLTLLMNFIAYVAITILSIGESFPTVYCTPAHRRTIPTYVVRSYYRGEE